MCIIINSYSEYLTVIGIKENEILIRFFYPYMSQVRANASVLWYYYPPEVRRREYWRLGVFLLQYFPFVNM